MTHYYVKSSGNDGLSGLDDANAWKTLSKVNGFAFVAGDIISFKRGDTWTGLLNITRSGSSGSPITYNYYSTGNDPIIQNSGAYADCVNINANYITIDHFKFQTADEYGIDTWNGAGTYVTVSNCEFYNCGSGLRFKNVNNSVIEYCYFHDLKMIHNDVGGDDDYGANAIVFADNCTAIHVRHNTAIHCKAPSYDYGYDGGFIEHFGFNISNNHYYSNWVEDCQGNIEAGSNNATHEQTNNNIHHNIFINNRTVFMIHSQTSGFACNWHDNYAYNNTIYETIGNGAWIVEYVAGTFSANTLFFRNNIVWMDTTGGGSWQRVFSDHGLTHEYNTYNTVGFNSGISPLGFSEYDDTDPLWVNKATKDFHLQVNSPCKSNALNAGFTLDYEDSVIPQGAGPDRGALEYDEIGNVQWGASHIYATASLSATGDVQGHLYWGAGHIYAQAGLSVLGLLIPKEPLPQYLPSRPATYNVWLLDANYNRIAMIKRFTHLEYKVTLDTYGSASLDFEPTSRFIPDMDVMKRLLILRNGEIVFGGIILKEAITIPNTAPGSEVYSINALDTGCYSDWRTVIPITGLEYDTRTGPADDIAKAYVDICAGPSAIAARRISDLSIAPNQSQAPSMTYNARNVILHTILQNIANQSGIDWRFVPLASSVEFRTAYPHWGLDRTRGNGVNTECVFSIDRRNFNQLTYAKDVLAHYNYFWVWGQGEGTARMVAEGGDDLYIGLYGRRERYIDQRQTELQTSLQAHIAEEIEARKPDVVMAVRPKANTWMNGWDLGDQVTLDMKRYGEIFTMNAKVTAISVSVADDGTEDVVPELEKL